MRNHRFTAFDLHQDEPGGGVLTFGVNNHSHAAVFHVGLQVNCVVVERHDFSLNDLLQWARNSESKAKTDTPAPE